MVQNQAFSLPVNLRRCHLDKATGLLELSAPDGSLAARISLEGGEIVGVESSASPSPAADSPVDRARAILIGLFALPDMTGTLHVVAAPGSPGVRIPISDVLIEGIKSVADSDRVSEWLGNRDEALKLIADPFARFSESSLGPAEGYFLSRIDRDVSVREILDDSAVDSELALRIVCAMRYANVLVPAGPASAWTGDRPPFNTARDATQEPENEVADSDELARAFYLVEEKLRSIQAGADFYAVLEVERRASFERIRASYRVLAKTFHPDHHARLAAFDADIKSRLEEIFTAINSAYSTLGNAKEREAYDEKIQRAGHASGLKAPSPQPDLSPSRKAAQVQPPQPPSPNPPKVAKGPVKPPIPIPVVPPLPRASKPSPPTATTGAPESASSHSTQSRKEAGRTPAETSRPTPPPAATQKPTVQPDALYEHGEAYAESGDWERAVQALMRGIEAAPEDARMHAKLGAALASLHGLNKRAESSLRKSLELDSKSAERFIEVAEVYLKFDRPEDAKTLFKRAFLIDPDNVAARSALDKLGVPGLSSEPRPGFLKRLFRKS